MPHLSFTRALHRHVACPDLAVEADNVSSALEKAFESYPKLRGYILNDQGGLHRHMAIMVNGQSILERETLATPLLPDDEVYIMQALSGG